MKSGLIGSEPLVSGGALYFVADDGTRGDELWKSDGTEAGTVIVKDINPGPGDGTRPGIVDLNGTLFFAATDGVTGTELWRSDGTAAGTELVKDIHPSQESFPVILTAVNDTLFFAAEDEANGIELWKSAGTAQGTVLVKDINPGTNRSFPNSMVNAGGVRLFRADDGVNGNELWRSDGTLAGTGLVQGDLLPAAFEAIGTMLYFREAGQQSPGSPAALWKTFGTTAGTQLVHPLDEGSFELDLAAVGNTLFVSVGPTVFDQDLWKSDGTPEGTVALKSIGREIDHHFAGIGNTLYLSVHTDENGQEPWTSDGTVDGTGLLKDIGIAPRGGQHRQHHRGRQRFD